MKTNVGYDVTRADTSASTNNIAQYIILELGKRKNKAMSVSALATLVYDKFPDFDLKDTGYSQFYTFVNSITGVKVTGLKNKQAKIDR